MSKFKPTPWFSLRAISSTWETPGEWCMGLDMEGGVSTGGVAYGDLVTVFGISSSAVGLFARPSSWQDKKSTRNIKVVADPLASTRTRARI